MNSWATHSTSRRKHGLTTKLPCWERTETEGVQWTQAERFIWHFEAWRNEVATPHSQK